MVKFTIQGGVFMFYCIIVDRYQLRRAGLSVIGRFGFGCTRLGW